ncbi:hypothetical protein R3W88_011918 [Solanum pinnatisectum]|uniref:WAT1-related protein n=1 Tax=Solanum pinnatisectum TaxID=50273 RepID=A0AAV9LB57_9SOLN|nr:hypothetical protein R3W88_011918 [Solanum pinnatisectum]
MGNELIIFVVMVIVEVAYAGIVIISKLVMEGGMNGFVQSAYWPIFATISIAPFAFFFERKNKSKLTISILFQIFLCSIFGISYKHMWSSSCIKFGSMGFWGDWITQITNAFHMGILRFMGTVTTSLVFFLNSWCIEKKDLLYVSMFNPLLLAIWIFVRQKMETSAEDIEVNKQLSKSVDLELQLPNSNDQN